MRGMILILVGLLLCQVLIAQQRYRVGLMPQVNLNIRLNKGWKFNGKIESRYILQTGTFGKAPTFKNQYSLTDIAGLLSRKAGANSSIAGGYQARIQEGQLIHRLVQQYSLVRRYTAFRLGHRFAMDQTFDPQDSPTFRLRYRISAEFPLNGQSVDPGEAYFKIGNEYLNALDGGEYDLEIRAVPAWGLAISDHNKLEIRVDYRLDAFVQGNTRHSGWGQVAWYLSW